MEHEDIVTMHHGEKRFEKAMGLEHKRAEELDVEMRRIFVSCGTKSEMLDKVWNKGQDKYTFAEQIYMTMEIGQQMGSNMFMRKLARFMSTTMEKYGIDRKTGEFKEEDFE